MVMRMTKIIPLFHTAATLGPEVLKRFVLFVFE